MSPWWAITSEWLPFLYFKWNNHKSDGTKTFKGLSDSILVEGWQSRYILSVCSHREFSGGPAVRTWHFHCYGPGFLVKELRFHKLHSVVKE